MQILYTCTPNVVSTANWGGGSEDRQSKAYNGDTFGNVQLAWVENAKTDYERIQNEDTKEIDFFTARQRVLAGCGDSSIRPIRHVGV